MFFNNLFSGWFSSKNKKLVKKWQAEHEKIAGKAVRVLELCNKNDMKTAKKEFQSLNDIATEHLVEEDAELYKVAAANNTIQKDTQKFKESFLEVKFTLIKFLNHYSNPDVPLDKEFETQLRGILGVLGERIDWEENNLYKKIANL